MDKRAIVLVGGPGSGKSTYAAQQQILTQWNWRVINQDSLGRFEHVEVFRQAIRDGDNIIVDRMDFNKVQRSRYIKSLLEAGYKIDCVVFRVGRQECFERMLKREGHPTIKDEKSANSALDTFFKLYEAPELDEGFDSIEHIFPNVVRRPCIISDLDGSLALIDHRRHFVENGKKDWKNFFLNMDKDVVCEQARAILERFQNDYDILYVSGRPADYYEITMDWLVKNELPVGRLMMRTKGDYRGDEIVKKQILDFDIDPYYISFFVIDDRDKVCKMWRENDVKCLQIAPGSF